MADPHTRRILEFGRTPRPGAVKTRLAATEGAVEAARIYRLLAERVHATLLDGQAQGAYDVVLCLPDGEDAWLEGAAAHWGQGDGDLGARLTRTFARAFEEGATHVLCVGTDVVALDAERLARAFRYLDEADVVLAPTPDGGYGLVGLKAPQPELFRDIPWSTDAVMHTSRARCREAGLRLLEIEGLDDVDVAADLEGHVPLVSILMPVWNEAARLPDTLGALLAQRGSEPVEVIVANGGSTDGSAAVARELGATVLETGRGRGVQLAAAAEAATGRWLWTVHADARPDAEALAGVVAFCRRDTHAWGFCETQVAGASPLLKRMMQFTVGRAQIFRMPYGDQGILVKRNVFDHRGGYPAVPLMEDVELSRALARYGAPGRVPATLTIDARRWQRHGTFGTTARNWWTMLRYLLLRTSPTRLARSYYRSR